MIVAAIAGAWAGPVADALGGEAPFRPAARSTYVVRQGDTLWSIATRLSAAADPRPLVDQIAAANGLQADSLVPGQTLVIPAGG